MADVLRISPCVYLHKAGTPQPELLQNAIALPQVQSNAFGDGTHPTTRLCAGAVDFYCRQKSLKSVLDVGTGTGVLARIARARGARFIVATDIDPAALSAARENIALDPDPAKIELSQNEPDSWGPRFDLVIANILEQPLRQLAPSLSRAIAPGGVLMISGFTRLQIPALKIAFEETSLIYVNEANLEDWALLMFSSRQ